MSNNDLLDMLGLADRLPAIGEGGEPGETAVSELAPPSPTVLKMDAWTEHVGAELAKQWTTDKVRADSEPLSVADCFGACFEPEPRLADNPIDQVRSEFLKTLLDTPEYQALHQHTQLNDVASEIATLGYLAELDALKAEQPAKPGIPRDMQVLRHVAAGTKTAKDEVDALNDACAACGLGQGAPGSIDAKRVADLYKTIRHNRTVRRICELAGRFRRFAQSRQRLKSLHGHDDMVGVVTDDDLARLLPHELAKLTDDDLELDFLRRFVEKQTMCRDYRAIEPVGKGPIIVIVDESGSMQGTKGETAKAIALAMAWIARQQKRWCALVAFSGGTEGRRLELVPGQWNELDLCWWLEAWLGGGTSLDIPIVEVPRWYPNTDGKTDMVCITDAIVSAPPEIIQNFQAWKAHVKCRMISVIVDSDDAGDLGKCSDEVHYTSDLGIDCIGVQNALSI